MRLVSWNVNGIRAVQRKGLWVPFVVGHDADVLCLQETKADEAQAACDLEGYHQFWNPAVKKGYSGTAILSRVAPISVTRGLPATIVKKHGLADDAFGNANDEGRVQTAEFEDFFLVNAYTPNAKGDLTRLGFRHQCWDPAFRAYLTTLRKKKPVAVCGDLNVAHTDDDVANAKTNRGQAGFTNEERQGFVDLLGAGYVDSFRIFTEGPGPLHLVVELLQRPRPQRRVAHRLLPGLSKPRAARRGRRDPCRLHGQRPLPREHHAAPLGAENR